MAQSNMRAKARSVRPLSPHLQIYKPMLTMMMSIFHRMTGAALYFGTVLLAVWILAAASDRATFDFVNGLFASPLGYLILIGYSWALIHHMLGGLRHFLWDVGLGFELPSVELLARLSIIGSLCLTLLLWALAFVL